MMSRSAAVLAPAVGVVLVMLTTQLLASPSDALFERGETFHTFVAHVQSQRKLWLRNSGQVASPGFVARLAHVRQHLRFLVIAEDWCVDSANTVPYLAELAASAHVPLRILDRNSSSAVMDRHRTGDGRMVTPLVVLLRGDVDAAAWVERPAPVQQWFRSMATDPASADRFARRQQWYDRDRGRTMLDEIVTLAERTQ
jgi:hypothetical protein